MLFVSLCEPVLLTITLGKRGKALMLLASGLSFIEKLTIGGLVTAWARGCMLRKWGRSADQQVRIIL
jgi:hypothetical protein